MGCDEEDLEIELASKRLKISEFMLGILVGIVISVIIEAVFQNINVGVNGLVLLIGLGVFLIFLMYVWYKKIVGLPDLAEYTCKFSKKPNFEWGEFGVLFSSAVRKNLQKRRYIGYDIYHFRWSWVVEKFTGYARSHIARTKLGSARAYVDLYRKEEKLVFLVEIPTFSSKAGGIVGAFRESMKDLERMNVIKKGVIDKEFKRPSYYHKSNWYPFIKKGKKINITSSLNE